jgi:hypothetical protein
MYISRNYKHGKRAGEVILNELRSIDRHFILTMRSVSSSLRALQQGTHNLCAVVLLWRWDVWLVSATKKARDDVHTDVVENADIIKGDKL